MAIFHVAIKNFSRSSKRNSIVAAAAYRASEKILEERTGDIKDYSNKKGVVHSEILAPEHAPEWVKDRAVLWNTVDACEKRKDARLAKEILVALPKELTLEQNIALVRQYCQEQFIDKGMIADLNIHHERTENPHAHILLTTREITPEGFGLKNRDWNKRELVFEGRKAWEDLANMHLAMAGIEQTIDSRSLKDRGIDIEPKQHLGQMVHNAVENGRGDDFVKYADQLDIMRINGDRIINDPSIALKIITDKQSVFTDYDVAKVANQYSGDLEQYNQVVSAIKSADNVIALGKDDYDNPVYSTKEMIELEHKMLDHAYNLNVSKGHKISEKYIDKVKNDMVLREAQKNAFNHLTEDGRLKVLTGFAGTGKSYLMAYVREAFEDSGYNVRGVALSAMAAENLEKESGIKSATIDKAFYGWDNFKDYSLSYKTILVIDEAGMVGTEKMEKLLDYVRCTGAKAIILHDTEQLGAIQAGAPSRAIAERFGQEWMTDILRQKDPEMKQATYEFGIQKTAAALNRYEKLGAINHAAVNETAARSLLIEAWATDRLEGKTQLIMAGTRESVKALNESAREVLISSGEIEKGNAYTTKRGERHFAVGDRVYFLENNDKVGVKNGKLGTITAIKDDKFKVTIDNEERSVAFNIKDYNAIDHGYATTVWKAQGQTFDKAYVLVSKFFDRYMMYVACSRHRESLQIYAHLEEFKNKDELYHCLGRGRSKQMATDYAEARNIQPNAPYYDEMAMPRDKLARQKLTINYLNNVFHEKGTFRFGKHGESVKGKIDDVITLQSGLRKACIKVGEEIVLVECQHGIDKHIGKNTFVKIDKRGFLDTCKVREQDRGDGKQRPIETLVEKGVTAKQREEMEWQKQVEANKSKNMSRGFELGL